MSSFKQKLNEPKEVHANCKTTLCAAMKNFASHARLEEKPPNTDESALAHTKLKGS
jgi:hypothetical protein